MNKTDGKITSYKLICESDIETFEKQVKAYIDNEYSYNYQIFGGVSIAYTPNGLVYAQAFVIREEFQEPSL